jgi:hypothetical protein
MADRINFKNKINDSVQVGDELYYGTTPTSLGTIIEIGAKYIKVDDASGASATDFFSFKKENTSSINTDGITVNSYAKSGAKGYYAAVKMSTPNDGIKTKLFALGSEVVQSSK